MGNVFGLVGGRAKEHIIDCLVVIDAITTDDAITNDDGGIAGNMQGSYSSRASSFVVLCK